MILTATDNGSPALSVSTTVRFDIAARPISITADAGQTKVYGDAEPLFSFSITSGSLAFSDVFSGSLSRDSGENVGSYAIRIGTLHTKYSRQDRFGWICFVSMALDHRECL